MSRNAESVVQWTHDALEFTWAEIAAMFGTTSRTLRRWRVKGEIPLFARADTVDELGRLRFWLEAAFECDLDRARNWLNTPLADLRGKTPMELVRQRRSEEIIAFLATAHQGAFL